WNVIDYFLKLVEEVPAINMKQAALKIVRDLELLQAALIHLPKVKNQITTMMSLLKKKSPVISIFWEKYSSVLKMIPLDHKLYVRKTQVLLEKEAMGRATYKRNQTSFSSSSSKP
ncbi:uncharacterized protein EV154DRAFT_429997, partial [Mucor mucedo]|uniref:uncharacterized protein n=1 Tax=Mucor mucedo TaxID=29922 RepID=UPI00222005D5